MRAKRLKCLMLAATMAFTGVLSHGLEANAASNGKWEKTDDGWMYVYDDNSFESSFIYSVFIDGWKIDGAGYRTEKRAWWHEDSKGWWFGDSDGWYACDELVRIDGKDCFFDSDGYLASGWKKDENGWRYYRGKGDFITSDENGYAYGNEWIDGYWVDYDGYQRYEPRAEWYKDSKGWYYMDSSGYYIKDRSEVIDGTVYYFDKNGYVKQYTELTVNMEARTVITFDVNTKDKKKANKQLENMLTHFVSDGKSETCNINGAKKKIYNKNGKIYIQKQRLESYIKKNKKVSISLVTDGGEISSNIFHWDGAFLYEDYDYKISFAGIELTNIKYRDMITITIDGKKYNFREHVGILVEGDARKAEWVRFLTGEGLISDHYRMVY